MRIMVLILGIILSVVGSLLILTASHYDDTKKEAGIWLLGMAAVIGILLSLSY